MSTERNAEDEYFAREEIEKHHKLAKELATQRAQHEGEALKAAHWHKCPTCGNDLQTISFKGVAIERCFHCHGTWLDAGELEKLAGAEGQHGLLDAVINVFSRTK